MKAQALVLITIALLSVLASAEEPPDAVLPPAQADLSSTTPCTSENPWAIANERCSGVVLLYDQCIPGIAESQWEERSINCEFKMGQGYTCSGGQCRELPILTGVWFYLPPVLVGIAIAAIAYYIYTKKVKKR